MRELETSLQPFGEFELKAQLVNTVRLSHKNFDASSLATFCERTGMKPSCPQSPALVFETSATVDTGRRVIFSSR